jgi:hypothetical protein
MFYGNAQESDEAIFVAGLAFDQANDDPWTATDLFKPYAE